MFLISMEVITLISMMLEITSLTCLLSRHVNKHKISKQTLKAHMMLTINSDRYTDIQRQRERERE